VHQTGAADEARSREAYGPLAARVTVAPFIDDMAAAYGAADLVIGRAGAMTLAELAVLGRPAILIPLPTAANDHQRRNAEAFGAAGGAIVLPQAEATPERLAELVEDTLVDRHRLGAMASAMRALGRPGAASAIVDRLEALANAR
jgi:UDP-N-acetylglucosamine--N-acetylmuramyl-(pentapeptide) pyrophosphoryl-undecaprenol N-acetylglucosamine transferase